MDRAKQGLDVGIFKGLYKTIRVGGALKCYSGVIGIGGLHILQGKNAGDVSGFEEYNRSRWLGKYALKG